MGQMAHTSIRAASASAAATVSRAARGNVSVAPASIAASTTFNAFVAFAVRPSSPRSTSGVAWWHRRLTRRPSGRRAAAAYLCVRLHKRFRVIVRSAPASRSRSASASFLRCASGRPACVACRRFVGFRNVRACVCPRIHFVLGRRGASQRHHLVSGSSVAGRPSPSRVLAVRLV